MALKGDFKEFGEFVKNLRKEKGLNQTESSQLLGAKYNLMLDIEAGIRKPSLSLIKKLAKLFEVDTESMQQFLPEKKEHSDSKKKEQALYEGIGNRLETARLKRDETFAEVADMLKVQRDHYFRMEKGVVKPNLIHIKQLASYFFHQYPLGKAVMYIIYGDPLGKTTATLQREAKEYEDLKLRFNNLSDSLKQAILDEEEAREKASAE